MTTLEFIINEVFNILDTIIKSVAVLIAVGMIVNRHDRARKD